MKKFIAVILLFWGMTSLAQIPTRVFDKGKAFKTKPGSR